jgi:hypothetical protein
MICLSVSGWADEEELLDSLNKSPPIKHSRQNAEQHWAKPDLRKPVPLPGTGLDHGTHGMTENKNSSFVSFCVSIDVIQSSCLSCSVQCSLQPSGQTDALPDGCKRHKENSPF